MNRLDDLIGRFNAAVLRRGRTWPFVGYRTRNGGMPWLVASGRRGRRPLLLLMPAPWHHPLVLPPCDPTPKDLP